MTGLPGSTRREGRTVAARAFWGMLGGAFLLPAIYTGPPKPREAKAMKEELIRIFLARYESAD
jgi:hypothetical protein